MAKNKYELWKMNLAGKAPSKRVEKKWWRRLIQETRRSNLDKISRSRKPRTYGEWLDLMDLKRTTRGYRKK